MSEASTKNIELPIKRVNGNSAEEVLTDNALHNILPARYLRKDENGEITETPSELFNRVAKNISLAELLHEAEERNTQIEVTPQQIRTNHSNREELVNEVFGLHANPNDDTTVPLTEENINRFSYDNIVPELKDEDLKETIERRKEQFRSLMATLDFLPNSPTISNAGNELQQLSACFVNSPSDDMEDIHNKLTEAAKTFKSGGGVGYAFHHLRPYGDPVGSTGGIASGPLSFMKTFDQMCGTIAQGGARRGAQMGVMRVTHPDIIHFIHSKNKDVSLKETLRLNDPDDFTHNSFDAALDEAQDLIGDDGKVPKHLRNAAEGHLSNFNISVGITNEFMQAVFNEEDYTLINPRTGDPHITTEQTKEMYSWYGLEDHVEVGKELSLPANIIWNRIIKGAHENGEPGVVFLDRINEQHSFPVETNPTVDPDNPNSEYEIHATNPCGEEPLMEGEACNLGHINLSTLVAENAPDWRNYKKTAGHDDTSTLVENYLEEAIDWQELDRRIHTSIRFLDDVVTMSDFPIEKITQTVRETRKIGLGVMGLAQMYIQMGIKYGSQEANEIAKALMSHINHESKTASRELADTRGVFSDWDNSKYANPTEYPEWFKHHTGEDPNKWEEGYPIRNHKTTSLAPTGTTSMLGNTTGGIEPIYSVVNYKNVTDDIQGDEMLIEFDDYFLRTLEANDIDVEAVKKEARTQMENNDFRGIEGLTRVPDDLSELFVTAQDLSPIQHAELQTHAQKGIDAAISKTINAPHDDTVEDAIEAFEHVYKNGGKGVTYYRDKSRNTQVLTTRSKNKDFEDEQEAAKEIAGQIKEAFDNMEAFLTHDEVEEQFNGSFHQLLKRVESLPEKTIGEPKNDGEYLGPRPRPDVLHGVTQRIDTGYGKLYVNINEDEDGNPFEVFCNIGNSGGFTNSFTESLAKIISLALRAGVDPKEIQEELTGIRSPKIAWDRKEEINSIPDGIGTALKRYLNNEVEASVPQQSTIGEVTEETNHTDQATVEDDPDRENNLKMEQDQEEMLQNGSTPECPECGGMSLYYSEGCKTCENCGWSEC